MQDIWDKLYEKAMKVLNPRKISDIVEVGGVASAVEEIGRASCRERV